MYAKLIILASLSAFVEGAGNKWAWKNVAEKQCNNCKCYNKVTPMELKPLRLLFAKKRYLVMANKLSLERIHIEFGNRGTIKTDQDLEAIAPFTFKNYFSRDMKKLYGKWTLGEAVTGSIVFRIRGNVLNTRLETGTSKKIQNIENSLIGDGFLSINVCWADDTNILFVDCLGSKGYSSWSLYSTSHTLSQNTKSIVLRIISELGFNPKRTVVMPH